MRGRPRILVFTLFTGVVGSVAFAENAPAAVPTSETEREKNPILAPATPVPPRPGARRLMSDEISARLASVAPKFQPPTPTPAPPAAQPTPPEPEDRPKNTIIRLPRYIVEGERPPTFKQRELLTPKAKLELAYKRHPGLRFGSLPFLSNDGIAREMIAEEEALERRRELAELTSLLAPTGDHEKDKQVREQVQETMSQTKSWIDTGGPYQAQKR